MILDEALAAYLASLEEDRRLSDDDLREFYGVCWDCLTTYHGLCRGDCGCTMPGHLPGPEEDRR